MGKKGKRGDVRTAYHVVWKGGMTLFSIDHYSRRRKKGACPLCGCRLSSAGARFAWVRRDKGKEGCFYLLRKKSQGIL